jgi:hypothetical protein
LGHPAALGDDLGDEGRVRLLERRAESLRRQIGEAHEAISPPSRRDPDPLEAAASRAHQVFAELTRQRMAEAEARRPEPRPFASRAGLPAADAECTGPDCPVCAWGRERDAERSAEVDRLMALGYSRETAEYAATPAGAEVYR